MDNDKNEEKWGSCITYAFFRYFREKDGYVCIRISRRNRWPFIKWPHFLFGYKDIAPMLYHFGPLDKGSTAYVPMPFFKGKVIHGDVKEKESFYANSKSKDN